MINFLRYRVFGLFFFVALIGIFIGGFLYKRSLRGYAFVYSIEFTGGTQILLGLSNTIGSEQVVRILEKNGYEGSIARAFASSNEMIVRVKQFDEDITGTAERIKTLIQKENPDIVVDIRQVDSVGTSVGANLWWSSLKAILLCLIIMLIYILIRFFSFGFAIGAVGSLFHDALLILTVCLLFDIEISMNIIAAIAVVLGYSINDTIIVFARIRENIMQKRGRTLHDIVNISLNETLRRTLLTTFSTMLPLFALIIFGGEVLRVLSVTLLIGFIFGTYSSIFVASPLMMLCTPKMKQVV